MDLLVPPSLPHPLAELQEQAEQLEPEEGLKGGERGRDKKVMRRTRDKDFENAEVQIY